MNHPPILAVAPNGAYKLKADHPALPLSTAEIVECAVQAHKAGASLLHLHIRDQQNQHSLDPKRYLQTIAAIRDVLGEQFIIQITSEAAKRFTPEQQIACIKTVNPENVSIALREILADKTETPRAQALFEWCAERACRIQYILYSETDLLEYFEYLAQGIIPSAPHSVLFVLGRYHKTQQSSPNDLRPYLRHSSRLTVPWMVCAFGAAEQACLLDAATRGGHMRQGFENNLYSVSGEQAKDNAQQLSATVDALRKNTLTPATNEQTRKLLHLRSG